MRRHHRLVYLIAIAASLLNAKVLHAQDFSYPRFRSAQLDLVTIGLSTSYVAACDVDLFALRSNQKVRPGHTMGLKAQVAKVSASSVGGGSMEAWDLDFGARHSIRSGSLVFDLYLGPSYSLRNSEQTTRLRIKGGFDIRFLFSRFLGLDAKLAVSPSSHNIGIGVTLGYFEW